MFTRPLRIGVSPRIRQDVPPEMGLHDKSLQYLEQSVADWIQSLGALCMLLPAPASGSGERVTRVQAVDYADSLDGLVLQGGKDIDPVFYGQSPEHILGTPDPVRDRFELDLVRTFTRLGKPVFGICRGMQLINVAFGGTLYQDLEKQGASAFSHVDRPVYDRHCHAVSMGADSVLSHWYGGATQGVVNSIHHQGVARLGEGLQAIAFASDGVVEAIWRDGETFVLGVQWHPEFEDRNNPSLLPSDPLMQAFLEACQTSKRSIANRPEPLLSTAISQAKPLAPSRRQQPSS